MLKRIRKAKDNFLEQISMVKECFGGIRKNPLNNLTTMGNIFIPWVMAINCILTLVFSEIISDYFYSYGMAILWMLILGTLFMICIRAIKASGGAVKFITISTSLVHLILAAAFAVEIWQPWNMLIPYYLSAVLEVETINTVMKALIVLWFVSGAVLFYLLNHLAMTKFDFRNWAKGTVEALVAAPIVLLVLQNIYIIAAGAIYLGIILGLAMILFKGFFRKDGNTYSHENTHIEKQSYVKKIELEASAKVYRDKGGMGIFVPTCDCIYYDNFFHKHEFICTVDDFQKGKFEIYRGKNKVVCI